MGRKNEGVVAFAIVPQRVPHDDLCAAEVPSLLGDARVPEEQGRCHPRLTRDLRLPRDAERGVHATRLGHVFIGELLPVFPPELPPHVHGVLGERGEQFEVVEVEREGAATVDEHLSVLPGVVPDADHLGPVPLAGLQEPLRDRVPVQKDAPALDAVHHFSIGSFLRGGVVANEGHVRVPSALRPRRVVHENHSAAVSCREVLHLHFAPRELVR